MSTPAAEAVASLVRVIADYPQAGISFKDITPILSDGKAFATVVRALADVARPDGEVLVDAVVGLEARGFIFGSAVALDLGVGFVPIRKPGKLPAAVFGVDYELEYGHARVEIHQDALTAGQRVLVVDDVLATGGTAAAGMRLVRQCGAEVLGLAVVGELPQLGGRERLGSTPVTALCSL